MQKLGPPASPVKPPSLLANDSACLSPIDEYVLINRR
jgi:hypothetical protein